MKRFFLFLVLVVGTGCFVNYQLPPEKVDKVADTVVADSQWETTLHNLLQTHVDTDGYVHYSNLEKEIARLHGIRKFWETVSPTTWSQEKQLAFWINVYNVMMWFNILEKKPTKVSEFNAYFFNEKKILGCQHSPKFGSNRKPNHSKSRSQKPCQRIHFENAVS